MITGLRSRGERFAVRGGGHSFAGRSTNADIVIDTSKLAQNKGGVRLDNASGIVTVPAGTRLGGRTINPRKTKLLGMYDVLAQNDRILAAGTCPDVGVIGNVLGGGLSAIPHFGYGAKGLREVTFVSFKDGKTYNVTDSQVRLIDERGNATPVTIPGLSAADLLKVFKGGGQASLGVVTEIKLQSQKMSDFRAASITSNMSIEETVDWLSKLSPEARRQFYFESHYDDTGKAKQTMRMLAPKANWDGIAGLRPPGSSIREIQSSKDFINTYLDNEGINSNQEQTRGANVMVDQDRAAVNFNALRAAAKKGIDTAVYQAPSSDGTILLNSPGSLMVEMEGNSKHGDLNAQALSVIAKGKPRRFVNYITSGIETKPEEYFSPEALPLLRRAMDEFNPKTAGKRITTSSLVDSGDPTTLSCDITKGPVAPATPGAPGAVR